MSLLDWRKIPAITLLVVLGCSNNDEPKSISYTWQKSALSANVFGVTKLEIGEDQSLLAWGIINDEYGIHKFENNRWKKLVNFSLAERFWVNAFTTFKGTLYYATTSGFYRAKNLEGERIGKVPNVYGIEQYKGKLYVWTDSIMINSQYFQIIEFDGDSTVRGFQPESNPGPLGKYGEKLYINSGPPIVFDGQTKVKIGESDFPFYSMLQGADNAGNLYFVNVHNNDPVNIRVTVEKFDGQKFGVVADTIRTNCTQLELNPKVMMAFDTYSDLSSGYNVTYFLDDNKWVKRETKEFFIKDVIYFQNKVIAATSVGILELN